LSGVDTKFKVTSREIVRLDTFQVGVKFSLRITICFGIPRHVVGL
jgi:hypothetical protein